MNHVLNLFTHATKFFKVKSKLPAVPGITKKLAMRLIYFELIVTNMKDWKF